MVVIHISEAEAAGDFAAVIAHVRAGAEVVIENGSATVAVVRPPADPNLRLLSESLRIAREREKETGDAPTLDPDFAADLEKIISSREPWNPPAWD